MAVQQFLKMKEDMDESTVTCALFHGLSPQFAKKIGMKHDAKIPLHVLEAEFGCRGYVLPVLDLCGESVTFIQGVRDIMVPDGSCSSLSTSTSCDVHGFRLLPRHHFIELSWLVDDEPLIDSNGRRVVTLHTITSVDSMRGLSFSEESVKIFRPDGIKFSAEYVVGPWVGHGPTHF